MRRGQKQKRLETGKERVIYLHGLCPNLNAEQIGRATGLAPSSVRKIACAANLPIPRVGGRRIRKARHWKRGFWQLTKLAKMQNQVFAAHPG